MEKVLGQGEIDALFASVRASAAKVSAPAAAVSDEPYNFSRAGQISNDQMRAISTVNDLFARNLMHTLGAWLRTDFEMALVASEQMPYADFVERLAEKTFLCSLRLEPLGATALLELELALTAPIVDLLLGGTGRAEQTRPLTDIEELIMLSVVQMVIKELNVAWQQVGLIFSLEKREAGAHVAKIMPSGEKTMCVSFEARMPQTQGAITMCLPSVVLNTILRRLVAERDRPRRRGDDVRRRVEELVSEAAVGTSLQLPPVRLRAREIAALRPGSLLRLPVPRHAAAELRVGGLALGGARAVRLGEHRGARLEGGPMPSAERAAEPQQGGLHAG